MYSDRPVERYAIPVSEDLLMASTPLPTSMRWAPRLRAVLVLVFLWEVYQFFYNFSAAHVALLVASLLWFGASDLAIRNTRKAIHGAYISWFFYREMLGDNQGLSLTRVDSQGFSWPWYVDAFPTWQASREIIRANAAGKRAAAATDDTDTDTADEQ